MRFVGHGHYQEIWEERWGDWFLRKLELKRTVRTIPGIAGLMVPWYR
jgi:hypothetical protein